MTDRAEITIARWTGPGPGVPGPDELLAAYHLRTQAEKGEPAATVRELPERYRAEAADPGRAFAGDTVLVASFAGRAVGCVVLTAPVGGRAEIKRLWTDPALRGRGVASGLLHAALDHAARGGTRVVRLSVWKWRGAAIALYERLGFTVTASWDEREELVCMERVV